MRRAAIRLPGAVMRMIDALPCFSIMQDDAAQIYRDATDNRYMIRMEPSEHSVILALNVNPCTPIEIVLGTRNHPRFRAINNSVASICNGEQ